MLWEFRGRRENCPSFGIINDLLEEVTSSLSLEVQVGSKCVGMEGRAEQSGEFQGRCGKLQGVDPFKGGRQEKV